MRDLKHLIRFEELLRAANNELVKQACAEGKLALGYNCSYIPEVLLDVEGCCGLRLRAPGCTSPDMATYYMTNRSCPYSKSILERAFEGGYNFLDALIGQECCCTMNRMEQYFEYCGLIPKEKFFVACIDMPINRSDWHVGYYRRQMEKKILAPLAETYGVDFSEDKLRAAIDEHNELCRIITEMGEMRKAENPVITGYEFHVMQLASLTCPKYLILPLLRETLEELKTREPEPKPWFRARVMVEGETALDAIARHYLYNNHCPRAMGPKNLKSRKQYIYEKALEYGAEGVIIESMKFCEYWGYERAQDAAWLTEGFEVPGQLPVCQIERDYTCAASGQLRTRFQAFVESLEIKRIQGAEQKEGA